MTRAWLFVPGHRPERFGKALASGADRVIVDLEDAVAPEAKESARAALAGWLATAPAPVVVRLNAADTPWFEADLALLAAPSVAAVVLPKAEDVAVLARLAALRPGLPLVPLVESALGLAQARALAAAPGVQRLAFGHIDFQVDLGLRDATEDELLPFRCELVLASRLARIAAPLDGVTVALDDAAVLQADVQRARRLGFGGKLCIHPRQVAAVQAGFRPGADEVAWAQRVLAAAPGVQRLAFGHIDFQVDLGLRDATEDDLLPFRCELVLASRLARIAAPLDGVTVALDDPAVLQADVQRARRLGFGGKLCIHPRQVAAVQAGFRPGADEVAWAQRVLAAAGQAGGAAVALDGKMIDKPVMLRAEAILRDAAE